MLVRSWGFLTRIAMPAPIPLSVRRRLYALGQRGWSAQCLSERFAVPVRTVRHLLQRWRQQPAVLAPRYAAGPGRPPAPQPARDQVLALRQQHPRWGAGSIRVQLRRSQPGLPVPSERTVQRWLRPPGGPPAPAGRCPAACRSKAAQPHEVWQIDAADQLRLGRGQGASWLRLVDECSGAFLQTSVFPPALLGAGGPRRRPALLAPGLRPLGLAPARAGGQRPALGGGGRLAAGAGPVAGGPGHRRRLEPAAPTPAKRGGGGRGAERQ